jgi:hypothetical protein
MRSRRRRLFKLKTKIKIKKMKRMIKRSLLVMCVGLPATLFAQSHSMQNFRPSDETGIHVFETDKKDTTPFTGLKVKIGGNFAQDFQALSDENTALPVIVAGKNVNQLMPLINGFNLAMANLTIDAQLADGVRMNLTTYLSSRHHEETWVKAGYIQFDKLPFIKSTLVDDIMKSLTIRVGDLEVDYGDQHFRRTDGGNVMYNPFVENYIMDEFATEIGGEVYYHSKGGILVMAGITNGELNPTVTAPTAIDTATGKLNKYSPAFHGKIGYDKQLNKDLRVRITGSVYTDKSAASNSLFWGDRTGSHYFFAMENTSATSDGNAWSGRLNPSFKEEVHAVMINPFIKFKGLELFGTYEMVKGRTITEPDLRQATQYAAELVYRFPAKENFWIGARYNSVTATLPGTANDVTVNRVTGSLGWFLTKNIMMKAEYVNQQYDNYSATNILSGGKFSGFLVEAAIGF